MSTRNTAVIHFGYESIIKIYERDSYISSLVMLKQEYLFKSYSIWSEILSQNNSFKIQNVDASNLDKPFIFKQIWCN